ncbi:MAG: radical SAM family heme chaperone HemW [Clostridia bacterium]|nr:radical SAM family heme chaperone HemW [Clostridia bacterium]
MAGIYVHVPFCKHKCTYCDFASYPREINKAEAYFACLLKEIDSRAQELKHMVFDTVYFGGGTPSFVNANLIGAALNRIKKTFNVAQGAEITIEINPGTVDEEKVELYKKVGFNRFSIGLQSADDKRLASLNRIHDAQQFLHTCELLGDQNISVDVMIGLKEQQKDEVKKTIDLAVKGGAKHISVYALTPEEGTPMFTTYLNGELPSEDETAELYDFAYRYLDKLGYKRYEVSNFALGGYYSRHNLNYWKRGEYVGLGVAASSCIENRRFTNTEKIDEYIRFIMNDCYAEIFSEKIEGDEIKSEFIMLALRTSAGINLDKYKNTFGVDFLCEFKEEVALEGDYLDIGENFVKIKDDYLYVQNQIIINFLK